MKHICKQKQLRAPHTACRKVADTKKWKKEMVQNILMDDDQELRDGSTERNLHVERILRRSSYGWILPGVTKTESELRVTDFV